MKKIHLLLGVLVGLVVSVAQAQYTGNYQTNTYNGAAQSTNWGTFYLIGNDTHHNGLQILNGAQLTSSAGYVGYYPESTTMNSVLVDGTGSLWSNGGVLRMGNYGYGNFMTISAGGQVTDTEGSVGYLGTGGSSSNNSVLVTGGGSLWNNSADLKIGPYSVNNQLTINNGGQVAFSDNDGLSSVGTYAGGNNNTVLVTGSGSMLTNAGYAFSVGYQGFGNQLTISAGGQFVNNNAMVGGDVGGSNSTALVTGDGSLWTNRGTLAVGSYASRNLMIISNGGQVANTTGYVGLNAGANNNMTLVTGSNSVWKNTAGLSVGNSGAGNLLAVNSGGKVTAGDVVYIGQSAGADNNSLLVDGSGSMLTNTAAQYLYVGYSGNGSTMAISNGGWVVNGPGVVGSGANNSKVVVDGNGSVWNNTSYLVVGNYGSGNQMTVSGGGKVANTTSYIGYGANNNTGVVTGAGAMWTNTAAINVGEGGSGNRLVVLDGGTVVANGPSTVGDLSGANNNTVLVSGSGSSMEIAHAMYVGNYGANNQMTVSNGARVSSVDTRVGAHVGANNNAILISGAGSTWAIEQNLYVGSNASTKGSGRVVVTDGGTLQAEGMVAGFGGSGVISNIGGVFQFALAEPNLTDNGYGNIVMTNGTMSFINVPNASVLVAGTGFTNIQFQGNNRFMLNSSTLGAGLASYTFDSVANTSNPMNYQALILSGTNSLWQSTDLTIGAGGSLNANASATVSVSGKLKNLGVALFSNQHTVANGSLYSSWGGAMNQFVKGLVVASGGSFEVTNGSSTVDGTITNAGMMSVVGASATYLGNVVNLGAYVSDPSTNTFNGNFTVGPTGTVAAASGDVYAMGKDFIVQSTNRAFDMHLARVLFATNGFGLATTTADHTFDLTGSGAVDQGSNWLNVAQLATNFSIGTLSLASNNTLTLTGTRSGSLTNALYVGWLDLWAVEGFSTNNMTALTNALYASLQLPNINLYYDKNLIENAYLGGLEYSLWGSGGMVIPIPEPHPAALTLAATLALLVLRRIRRG